MKPHLQEPAPTDGITGILDLFEQFSLVALGEMHGLEQEAAFIADVVRHPAFSQRVHAIVVEFGNAFHQALADRFVAGDSVAHSDVRRIWRDVAGAGPWGLRAPIYEQFFATVRAVNQTLPSSRRLRVLLGDPPVDWQAVRTPADARATISGRDAHFARVVEQEVLGKGQRALLIAGGFHFTRAQPSSMTADRNVSQILDRDYPAVTYVVLPHVDSGLPEQVAELEARMASWPIPALAPVRRTWLGALSAATTFERWQVEHVDRSGASTVSSPFAESKLTLGDLADGYLNLGPSAAFTYSRHDPALVDDEDRAEVDRRAALTHAGGLPT
jgi:hypothetical protein